jgi:16S rRNA (guanine(527)-N(7))-methyltransferase RsmG
VSQRESAGQQGNASVGQGLLRAVGAIAPDGTAAGGQLGPDLVTTTGLQSHFQQAFGPFAPDQAIAERSCLSLGSALRRDPAQTAVAHQAMFQVGRILRRAALDHGQVSFGDGTLPKLGAEPRRGLGGARQHQDAGHRGIQAMDHAHEDLAGFGVARLEPALGQIHQVGLGGVAALHNQTRWFIEHQQVIVLIKDGPTRMKKNRQRSSFPTPNQSAGQPPGRAAGDPPGPHTLASIFAGCGVTLSQQQTEQLWIYHGLLRSHNPELNLTRIHNFTNMVLKLYVDSVLPAQLTALPSPLMDLGSGPGMPGIPLKIVRPELEIFLAEGRAKRVTFLREAITRLGLAGIDVIDRNITAGYAQPVAGVVTRAVETMDQTLARIHGCLEQNGRVIFMKGPGCEPEIEQVKLQFAGRFALVEDRAYRIGQTSNERRLVVFQRLDAPPAAIAAQAARRHRVVAIDSEQNSRLKSLKRLLTGRGVKKEGQALLAGRRPVAEMLAAAPERCLAWITPGDQPAPPGSAPAEMQWLQLADPLFQTLDLFGTRSPLLCIRVPEMPAWSPQEGFTEGCSLLVPFQDPENVGAVIRSAAAFGVTQVILLAESAHPYHPKALRAAGGTTVHVRLRQGPALNDLPRDLAVLSLSADGQPIAAVDFPEAFGLLAGLEGEGVPAAWREKAVRIPMMPTVESLNAAVATAVALYEWRRRNPRAQR